MSRSLWRLVPTERPKEGPYTQFAPLAEALDLPYAGAPELTVRINSAPVTFALDINSGTVVGVIMTIGLEGPPSGNAKMTLRKETSTDRDGKRRGINREVQTGDREFDSEVYVDSDASDFETKRILSKPTVRAAVRELIRADCTGIEISKSTLVGKFAPAVCQGAGLVNALEALMIVASAGAPREKGEPRHGAWLQTLTTLVMVVMVASIPIAWSTLSLQYNGWLAFFGAILGLGLALVWRPLVARVTSGDSGSFARYRAISVMFGMIGLLLGGSGAVLLNAKLDKSQPITIDGTVTSTSYDDEDDRTSVKCDWQNGTHDSSSMSGHVYTGTQVTKQQWKGALGFRWSTRPRIKR